ncbi:alkaline shock response membrane anchor protein AmaP [Streptomyces sp. H10-C2]|uniref:alkaline shock response membrane anchor protein AmaP n=1 Tax=unclassified Streptomyces TaxID=2593676 RepID=UPI0024BA2CA6|nr:MULTISPECIES: alkaline shock response membrane anchor protein AmaP [unclassified Streptomyces]MDJ0346772.1 alkaline shock response membrane anchor protein AmaP [Streptomyces sp. PH10-H1]MDJ0374082.1 alkaline shock response membrane anchor protein AmaP [Streptomyces sp. H10-C2]
MLKTVNRVLLALAGLGLFALGGGVLLGGLDLQRRWNFSTPSWWPFTGPDDVVLGTQGRTRFRDNGWWWPVVFAVLGSLLLLLLWWLLAQLHRRRLREVLVDSGDGGGARLRGHALEHVMAAEAEALEGVSRAHVRLTGRRTAPEAHVQLVLEAHAKPAATLTLLTGETLGHARTSAGLERLPAKIRLQKKRHRAQRVT